MPPRHVAVHAFPGQYRPVERVSILPTKGKVALAISVVAVLAVLSH